MIQDAEPHAAGSTKATVDLVGGATVVSHRTGKREVVTRRKRGEYLDRGTDEAVVADAYGDLQHGVVDHCHFNAGHRRILAGGGIAVVVGFQYQGELVPGEGKTVLQFGSDAKARFAVHRYQHTVGSGLVDPVLIQKQAGGNAYVEPFGLGPVVGVDLTLGAHAGVVSQDVAPEFPQGVADAPVGCQVVALQGTTQLTDVLVVGLHFILCIQPPLVGKLHRRRAGVKLKKVLGHFFGPVAVQTGRPLHLGAEQYSLFPGGRRGTGQAAGLRVGALELYRMVYVAGLSRNTELL